jgi:hypothetical protein
MQPCDHDGCDGPIKAQGLCARHYHAARRSGRLARVYIADPVERFWSFVDKTDGCWLWTGHTARGYGFFSQDWKRTAAHRVSYEWTVGPIPNGMQLDHLCRNPRCVRPDHLEPVTGRENLMRGTSFVSVNAAKTHCAQGHELSEANTRHWKGHRICRTCARAAQARYRARQQVI